MKPYHKNPRKISDKQLSDLRRWLDELGDLSGIVHDMNSDEIIGGNQRTAVLGFSENDITITERLPEPDRQGTIAHGYILWHGARYAYRQVAWTPEQCERANIIANKAGGDWEIDRLLSEFETAVLLDSGFGQDELDDMLAELEKGKVRETADAEPQTSRADELKQEWATETGQLWILPSRTEGQEHRLICGDCTDKAVVERVMGGEKAELTVTDPPYNVNYDPQWRIGLGGGGKQEFANGKVIQNDDNFSWVDTFKLLPSDVVYCWTADRAAVQLVSALEGFGFQFLYLIIWNKDLAVFGRGDYHHKHEPCLYMVRRGSNHNWQGDRKQETVWDIPTIHSFANGKNKEEWGLVGHGNQKPTECMARPIKNNSAIGGIVYDPFGGSGTTMIASENLGRQCRMVEIDAGYCAVILQRYLDAFQIRPYLAP